MTKITASVPITVRGRYLWKGDERFFVRGVVYQLPNTQDPISDARLPQLQQDIVLFKELGLNTLFVYMIDDTKRHGQAMELLQDAGIYVFTAVSSRFNAINRLDPYGSYHRAAMTDFFQTVDVMAQYPNTLGLLAGIGIMNSNSSEKAAPVLKAVVRDLKRYMKLKNAASGHRILPIGYTATTVEQLNTKTSTTYPWVTRQAQLTSGPWAGQSSMQMSGYEALVSRLRSAAIPIFMSEYGTNLNGPRLFQETAALYSPQMSQVFSGGCVYEFWQSSNCYGLVELPDQGQSRDTPAWAAEQRREQAIARSNDPKRTAEKRKTERGLLSILHDFVNYKTNLDATRNIDKIWEGDVMEGEAAERANVDTTQRTWPWEPEFQVPETAIDWKQLEDHLSGNGLLHVM